MLFFFVFSFHIHKGNTVFDGFEATPYTGSVNVLHCNKGCQVKLIHTFLILTGMITNTNNNNEEENT